MCTFRMSTGSTVRPAYVTDYTTIERTDLGCATTPKNRCMLTPGTRTIGTLITHHLSPLTQSAWPAFFPLVDFRLSSMNVCSLSKRWLPLSLRRQDQKWPLQWDSNPRAFQPGIVVHTIHGLVQRRPFESVRQP